VALGWLWLWCWVVLLLGALCGFWGGCAFLGLGGLAFGGVGGLGWLSFWGVSGACEPNHLSCL
jgi:hypothetical protein